MKKSSVTTKDTIYTTAHLCGELWLVRDNDNDTSLPIPAHHIGELWHKLYLLLWH